MQWIEWIIIMCQNPKTPQHHNKLNSRKLLFCFGIFERKFDYIKCDYYHFYFFFWIECENQIYSIQITNYYLIVSYPNRHPLSHFLFIVAADLILPTKHVFMLSSKSDREKKKMERKEKCSDTTPSSSSHAYTWMIGSKMSLKIVGCIETSRCTIILRVVS